ncbi:MAG TPA: VOC family protein [Microbacterium sp.]|nr:VOC family protein [Microbacterium sp.]
MATLGNITFYADDPRRLAHFWAEVFRYPPLDWEEPVKGQLLAAGLAESDLAGRALAEDPTGAGPRLFFHHADATKSGRNRIHLDVTAPPLAGRDQIAAVEAEKDRLLELGASVVRLVDQTWGPWPEYYYQLRDPEGNEFCLQ